MSYYVFLEAETGKVYVRPFADWEGIKAALNCSLTETVKGRHLPDPFRMVVDDDGLHRGKPINFMGSFYYGLPNGVLFGDVAILKASSSSSGYAITGLDDVELRFLCLSLNQAFGVSVPGYVAV